MKTELRYYDNHPSGEKTHLIETTLMPVLEQDSPFDAKVVCEELKNNIDEALKKYHDKRYVVKGIARKIGPDIHNKPSIELSDRIGGDCFALCIFPNEEFYSKVSVGDTITLRANYLVTTDLFGVVMKNSELIEVEK